MIRITYVDSAGFLGMVESESGNTAARAVTAIIEAGDLKDVRSVQGDTDSLAEFNGKMSETRYLALPS